MLMIDGLGFKRSLLEIATLADASNPDIHAVNAFRSLFYRNKVVIFDYYYINLIFSHF